MDPQFFRTKSIDQLISDADQPEKRLKKSLGWLSLTSLGIGAVIGSGIFTIVGTAIAGQTLAGQIHPERSPARIPDLPLRIIWQAGRGTRHRAFLCACWRRLLLRRALLRRTRRR